MPPVRSSGDLEKTVERGTALRIRAIATSLDVGFANILLVVPLVEPTPMVSFEHCEALLLEISNSAMVH